MIKLSAWTIIGIALRSAYRLGLRVHNKDPYTLKVEREMLVRTWWSLCSLEQTLITITGRPSITVDFYCSVPLQSPVTEEQIWDEIRTEYRACRGSVSSTL